MHLTSCSCSPSWRSIFSPYFSQDTFHTGLTSLLDMRQIQTNRLPNKYHNLPETSCPQKPSTILKADCSYRIQMLWGRLTAGKFIIDAGMHGTPRRRVRAEGQNWMVGIFSPIVHTHYCMICGLEYVVQQWYVSTVYSYTVMLVKWHGLARLYVVVEVKMNMRAR